jgi:hypothetical protein
MSYDRFTSRIVLALWVAAITFGAFIALAWLLS